MKNNRFAAAIGFVVMFCLVGAAVPQAVWARNSDDEKVIRLHTATGTLPIGRVFSLGAVSIDGKAASGEQILWGGEMLQAFSESGAALSLETLGQVSVKQGALLRVAPSETVWQDETSQNVLVASLLRGEISVRLRPGVSAYIQSCGQVFTSSRGATFRLIAKEGKAEVETGAGSVQIQSDPKAQHKYFVRPVGAGSQISVKARTARQIQVQVTDENDKPVPDLPIVFVLGSAGAGSLRSGSVQGASITSPTNAQGIATVQYNAGAEGNSSEITATVEGTRFSWTGTISVTKAAGFWTPLHTTLVVAGVAAGVATGVVIATQSGNNSPVRANGGPNVTP